MSEEINKINETVERWTQYLVNDLKKSITRRKIFVTGQLESSLKTALEKGAEGDINKITLNFLMYGRMLDMAVHKGVKLGDVGTYQAVWKALGVASGAKAKRWYSPVMYGELKDLSKQLSIAYAGASSVMLTEQFNLMKEINIRF